MTSKTLLDRFESKVVKASFGDHDEWSGTLNRDGYGTIKNEYGRNEGAHRVAFRLYNGPIPAGMFVLHTCDERCCVNPKHLFLGTNQANMDDMIAKGRKVIVRGESHGMTPLTDAQVREIRADPRSSRALAPLYSVSRVTISNVKSRRTWAHLK